MNLKEATKKILDDFLESHKGNARAAADALGVNHVTFWGWVRGTRTPALGQISDVFARLGVKVSLPEWPDETSREVCFVDAKIVPAGEGVPRPEAESYLAVPLVGEAGAGPGIIAQDDIKSWVLVYRGHRSVQRRSNLLAVEVGRGQTSMIPTLHPEDVVLVDRDDWGQQSGYTPPGNIYLVREPGQEGGGMVKRVALAGKGDMETITFYSDNKEVGPDTHLMSSYDHDLRQAIVGKVVWSWCDLSRK